MSGLATLPSRHAYARLMAEGEEGRMARSLGSELDPRNNALNLLRLCLAGAVIVSHSWTLGGFRTDPQWGGMTLGEWAVAGFFSISGWLIMASRIASTPRTFYLRRARRIVPAFVVCLLSVAFVFAPLGAWLGPGHYSLSDGLSALSDPMFLLGQRTAVGDTLATTPFPDDWAGSLWTLAYEMVCYILAGVLVSVVPRRHLPATVGLVWLALVSVGQAAGAPSIVMLGVFFFSGALLYLGRNVVLSSPVLAFGLAALTGGMIVGGVPGHVLLVGPAVAYLMIWGGASLRGRLAATGRRNDISYGVYIYGFPVQQLLVLVGVHEWGMGVYVLATFVCTVPLAAGSWFFVERPAMRWRRSGGGSVVSPARDAQKRLASL